MTDSKLDRSRAETTAERCQRCNGAGMRPCECGCGPMPCECRARHRSAPVTADVCGRKCDHGSTTPRAELTGEERVVLEAAADIDVRTLEYWRDYVGGDDADGLSFFAVSELARRAARKESKP